ncbi:MAG: CDP-diacylglycerol--glycerol-3-phosphate 3-phosphatidyltransferase [Bryobacteraceae bacterium]
MNGPNLLTLSRIFLVPLLVAALLSDSPWLDLGVSHQILALLIFLAAAATDLLDGYLARRWSQITTLGMLLDPIADKLLISAALVSLVDIHRVPSWMVILIISREFAVTGLRSIAASAGFTIAASELGKTKMVAQVIAIALVIAGIEWPVFTTPGILAMWAVMAFALLSAADYLRKFWHGVDQHVTLRRRKQLLEMQRQQRRAKRAALHVDKSARRTTKAASETVAPR